MRPIQHPTSRNYFNFAFVLLCIAFAGCTTGKHSGHITSPQNARWTNSLGMVFVPVPGITAKVSIWETRVRDFAAFTATNPALDGTNWNNALYHGVTPVTPGPDYPVVDVSWNDATAFCSWLTGRERAAGVISSNAAYRLPTDGEWSFAAGIGALETGATPKEKDKKLSDVFPWGTTYPPPAGVGNFGDETAKAVFTNWPYITNYTDGFATAAMSVWSGSVSGQYVPYVRPQENGNKEDVRWAALTDSSGRGMLVVAEENPVSISALHFTAADLASAKHAHELKPRAEVVLSLDARMAGLGNSSCSRACWSASPCRRSRIRCA